MKKSTINSYLLIILAIVIVIYILGSYGFFYPKKNHLFFNTYYNNISQNNQEENQENSKIINKKNTTYYINDNNLKPGTGERAIQDCSYFIDRDTNKVYIFFNSTEYEYKYIGNKNDNRKEHREKIKITKTTRYLRIGEIEHINPETFQFLYQESGDNLYGKSCFFKDKNYIYRDDKPLFSGFDYDSFKILTGIIEYTDLSGNIFQGEDTCLWGCFEDKDSVYYLGDSSNDTNLQWIRNIKKKFPKDASFDNVRNSIISNK